MSELFKGCRKGLKLISVNDYGNPLLPFNDRHDIDCRRDPRESGLGCFLAGDVRANEQVHIIFTIRQ
jgi:hypothetical protein